MQKIIRKQKNQVPPPIKTKIKHFRIKLNKTDWQTDKKFEKWENGIFMVLDYLAEQHIIIKSAGVKKEGSGPSVKSKAPDQPLLGKPYFE